MKYIPQLTFNLILFGLLAGLSALGFVFGENRIKNISYGAFIGFFILIVGSADSIGGLASKASLPVETAKLSFVAVVCLLMFLGALISQKKSNNKIRSIILAIITTLFICGFGVSLLSPAARESMVTDFNLAAQIYNIRYIVMLVLAAWLILIQLIPEKKEDDKKK